jgi:CHAT domain-containing protein/tetratricopeptide (TPR) repeat protein
MKNCITFFFYLLFLNLPAAALAQSEPPALNENPNFKAGQEAQENGKWDKARADYELALADVVKQKNWEAYAYIIETYASTYYWQEDYLKGVDFCIKSLQNINKRNQLDYLQEEKIRYAIGAIYYNNRDWAGAFIYWQEYLAFLKNYYPLDSNWKYAEAYWWIAIGEKYAGNRDKEIEHLKRSIAIIKTLLQEKTDIEIDGPNHVVLKRVFKESSWYYIYHTGEVEKAQGILEEAITLTRQLFGKETSEVATFYDALGSTYRYSIREYTKAIECYEKALYALNNKDPFEEFGLIYLSIAACYSNIGQPEKVIEYLSPCLDIEYGDLAKPRYKISVLVSIAYSYLKIGDIAKCEQYLEEADQLLQHLIQTVNDPREYIDNIRGMKFYYAELYKRTGKEHLVKQNYLAMANDYPMVQTPHLDIPILLDISDIYIKEVNVDSALYYNSRALSNGFRNGYREEKNESPDLNDLVGSAPFYRVLKQRMRIWEMKAQLNDSIAQQLSCLEKAIETSNLADDVHLHYLQRANVVRGAESEKIIGLSILNYRQSLLVAAAYHSLVPNGEIIEKGFYFTQKMKAQQLWMALLASEAKTFGKMDEALLEKEAASRDQITKLEKEMEEALNAKDSTTYNRIKYEDLFEQKEIYTALQKRIESTFPEYHSYKYNFKAETEQSLSSLLRASEVLVEYVIADTNLLIFTMAKDSPLQLYKVSLDTTWLEQLNQMNGLLQNSAMNRPGSRNKFIKASHALYQQFMAPIEAELKQKSRIIIIGDGLTNYIPFEALVSSSVSLPFNELDFLIRRFEISYHYASNLFAKARRDEQKEVADNIFAFAPVYDQDLLTDNSPSDYDIAFADTGLRAFDGKGAFAPLPESERETKSIIQLFEAQGNEDNKIVLRSSANEGVLKTNLSKPYRFIHIAGHSFANLNNPKFSGIACSGGGGLSDEEDGILYTDEIYNLNIQADLVSLSSCESGYGRIELSEGVIGLNRSVIYAGGNNVLFSLWKVFDKVSADLMIDFYKEVLSGKTYAAALRSAKLNILNEKATASPHYWSPFLLIGR